MSLKEGWHKLEHWGSQHPVLLGLGIFIVGAIILWMLIPSRSPAAQGGTTIAQPMGPSDAYYQYQASLAASGNALQIATLETQAASDIAGKQLVAKQTEVAGNISIADLLAQRDVSVTSLEQSGATSRTQIEGATAGYLAGLEQSGLTSRQQIAASSMDYQSTLAARVASENIAAQQTIAGISAGAATTQAQIAAGAYLGGRAYDAQINNSTLQAQLEGLRIGGESAYQQLALSSATQLASQGLNIIGAGTGARLAISGIPGGIGVGGANTLWIEGANWPSA